MLLPACIRFAIFAVPAMMSFDVAANPIKQAQYASTNNANQNYMSQKSYDRNPYARSSVSASQEKRLDDALREAEARATRERRF
ncbi:hypothetical protein [Methylobacterium sp. 174MFSha1.1]|uniref:hypothetical protein n=1 Tax=Methylobacterium sp. 174MFSha1.1 TaxID=1502749 RepID=UPI001160B6F2|nr:hypothetical protein [Methylobacterium sp. 174MFSha1.1]